MAIRRRNWLIAGFIVAFPLTLFLLFLLFLKEGPPPTPPKMPVDNGYDDFQQAAKSVRDDDYSGLDHNALRVFVDANSNALQLARSGMQKECHVPVRYSESYLTNDLEDLQNLRRLTRAFLAEGRLAEMEGRTNDAANAYLDVIRLGNDGVRGGLLIDELVGIAIRSMGVTHLEKLVLSLDSHVSRGAAAMLEAADADAQTFDDVMQQEGAFFRAIYRGLRYDLLRWESRKLVEPAIKKAREKFNVEKKNLRRLTLDLAVHACELDQGHPPAGARDLVPDYLRAVPKDPVTGAEMVLK